MNKQVEAVLEVFIRSEIEATDTRIGAIRTFVDTLKQELIRHSSKYPTEEEEKKRFSMALNLFRNMIATYDEEVKLLIRKREKMLDHLLQVRAVVSFLRPASLDKISDLHIN